MSSKIISYQHVSCWGVQNDSKKSYTNTCALSHVLLVHEGGIRDDLLLFISFNYLVLMIANNNLEVTTPCALIFKILDINQQIL